MQTAIYARISDDDGSALGVARQEADCRAEAERRGWTVAEVFTDNDVSATRSKVRPAYQRMLEAVAAGRVQALVVWDVDRLTRTPRELEDVIDLADRHDLSLASCGGEIDLATSQGRLTARIKGAVARQEAEQIARRVRRQSDERAAAGRPAGYPPFGATRVDGRDVPHPVEGPVVRDLARRLLAGESLSSLARSLNERGIRSRLGKPWNSTTLRQMLAKPSLAGFRVHRGEIVGRGNGDPVLTEDEHARIVALFTDPVRRAVSAHGRDPRHLLSMIAVCGLCGGRMRRSPGRIVTAASGAQKRQPPAYTCSSCTRVRRRQETVDELVTEVVLARLERADAADLFATGDPAGAAAARDAIAGIDARKASAADAFAAGDIDASQLSRITARLREDRSVQEAVLAAAMPPALPLDAVGERAREVWGGLKIEQQRALVQALMRVTILPQGSGRTFDPETVRIEWATEAGRD